MNKSLHTFLVIIIAVVSGFLGGRLANSIGLHAPLAIPGRFEETISAQEFVLIGKDGQTYAVFSVTDELPGLVLTDKTGKPRVGLLLKEDGAPTLRMYNKAGETRVELGIGSDGSPTLGLGDQTGNVRVLLAILSPEDNPTLLMSDKSGQLRTHLGLRDDDSPFLTLADKEGTRRIELAIDQKGKAGLGIGDSTQKAGIAIGVKADGSPRLRMVDSTGKTIWDQPR